MTAEEIRAEAIERLAIAQRAMYRHPKYASRDPLESWAALTELQREAYRKDAARLIGALGDLLPTGEEISTCFPDEPAADEEAMRRYVTDWKAVG